jgi:hypothetical protein
MLTGESRADGWALSESAGPLGQPVGRAPSVNLWKFHPHACDSIVRFWSVQYLKYKPKAGAENFTNFRLTADYLRTKVRHILRFLGI